MNIFQHVQCRWNNFEIISLAEIILVQFRSGYIRPTCETRSSAMAERPRELDQRFQGGRQFEAKL